MISFHKYCSIRVWINKFLHRQSCLAVLSNFWLAYKSVWCVSNSLISFCAKTFSQSFNWYIMMSCKYSFEKTRIFLRFIVWWINFSTFYILEISTNIISIREINLKMSLDLEIDWNIYFFQSHQKIIHVVFIEMNANCWVIWHIFFVIFLFFYGWRF